MCHKQFREKVNKIKLFKAVLFDMDGVIVDTVQLFWESSYAVIRKKRLPVVYEDFVKKTVVQGISLFSGPDFTDSESGELRAERDRYYTDFLKTRDILNPYVTGLLESLSKKGIKLGIGTSSRKIYTDIIMERFELAKYFDGIITRDDVENIKPSPDIYLKLAEKLKVSASESLVIEDSGKGVMAAKNGNFQVIVLANPHYDKFCRYEGAACIFSDVKELQKYLEDILS